MSLKIQGHFFLSIVVAGEGNAQLFSLHAVMRFYMSLRSIYECLKYLVFHGSHFIWLKSTCSHINVSMPSSFSSGCLCILEGNLHIVMWEIMQRLHDNAKTEPRKFYAKPEMIHHILVFVLCKSILNVLKFLRN